MSQPLTIDQAFQLALSHHQAGRLAEAESLYRQILAVAPGHADALHLLGVMACQLDKNQAAVQLISEAISLNPRHPAYHSNLGEAHRKLGQVDLAIAAYRRALQLDPRFGDAHNNLAVCLLAVDRLAEAEVALRAATAQLPDHALLWRNLGDVFIRLRRNDDAITAYGHATRLDPSLTDAHFNLALALGALGRQHEAAASFRKVLAATPNDLAAWNGLAEALSRGGGDPHAALAAYREILARDPANFDALAGTAHVLRAGDHVDAAIEHYRRALAGPAKPNDPTTLANLAFALRDYAQLEETLTLLRQAVAAQPDNPALQSAIIFTLQLDPALTQERLAREEATYNARFVAPLERLPHANDRTPGRRLRIGYVSADLRGHPVGRFMLPLLQHHDRTQVELFCYSNVTRPDALARQLQQASDHWRQISPLNDADAAALVREDRIDILIDLNMHAIDNRLGLFALKPAPVQVTYLAYCGGTGLSTIDYRLSDATIDPPGTGDDAPWEKPLRLDTYWCYHPNPHAADVAPLPFDRNGHITFGSFNYFSKTNPALFAAWAELLLAQPSARLHLHVPQGSRQDAVRSIFAAHGIAAERLTLLGRTSEARYFQQYHDIDISLDTFPFAGGTTTCDALYMGVPVITLAGSRTVSRGGASILTTLQLPDLITHDFPSYVSAAGALAGRPDELRTYRQTLRARMQSSLLMNAPAFAHSVEAALRRAWTAWCASPG